MPFSYDTKKLFDAAQDNGVRFGGEDVSDCLHPWKVLLNNDTDFLQDIWLDALADMSPEKLAKVMKELKSFVDGVDTLNILSSSEEHRTAAAICQSSRAAWLGTEIGMVVRDWIDVLVEDNAEDWYEDCYGYLCDMEQGARDDYEYERWKDAQMEKEA